MVNTIQVSAKSWNAIPADCWVFENKEYTLEEKSFARRILPCVEVEHEDILKECNIAYRRIKESDAYLEYWDKDDYEEETITLPLYVKIIGEYKYTGKAYTGKKVTISTAQKAWELSDFVRHKIKEKAEKMRKEEWFEHAKAIFKESEDAYKIVSAIFDVEHQIEEDLELKDEESYFKLLTIKNAKGEKVSEYYGLFDMKKIHYGSSLQISVPTQIVCSVIGRQGCNIKRWADELGVKRINVVPE